MIMVYITCKDNAEARRIAKHLISKRLIACANIFPVKSMYRWKGKFVDGKEIVIIGKTLKSRFEKIKKEVKKMHSYDIPLIVMLEARANNDFEKWVWGEVK